MHLANKFCARACIFSICLCSTSSELVLILVCFGDLRKTQAACHKIPSCLQNQIITHSLDNIDFFTLIRQPIIFELIIHIEKVLLVDSGLNTCHISCSSSASYNIKSKYLVKT